MGLDYTVLLHSVTGVEVYRMGSSSQVSGFDPEAMRILCRAINAYRADISRDYADRMTPVAAISMHHPQEAIKDLSMRSTNWD